MIQKVSFANLSAPPALGASRSAGDSGPQDQVVLGARPEEIRRPAPRSAPRSDQAAESDGSAAPLPLWMRATCGAMAGLMGMVALSGCGPKPQAPPPSQSASDSEAVTQAKQRLEQSFSEIEKSMDQSRTGDTKEQSGAVTRQLMDAVGQYAKDTGRSAQQVANDLTEYMKKHPAVTLTVVFAAGTAAGVGLEKLGLTDGISNGLGAIKDAAKEHPLVAGLIVTAAAAGTAWLIYDYVQAEQPAPAPVPDTPASQQLRTSLDELEKQVQASNPSTPEEAQAVNKSVMEKVKDYARESGRTASEVASDVKTYLVEHPGVAAAIVAAAGVGTGVVLERAGVPAKIADVASSVLESGKNGLGSVGEKIKEHPYLSGAIAVAVAAGAGYLIYQHIQPEAPAPAAPAASAAAVQAQEAPAAAR